MRALPGLTWLRHMTLVQRMGLMAGLPVIALLALVGKEAVADVGRLSGLQVSQRWTTAAVAGGDLVHAIQRERGASSIFMTSGGQRFGAELRSYRTDVDTAWDTFDDATTTAAQGDDGAGEYPQLAELDAARAELASRRTAVDGLPADRAAQIGYFTGVDDTVLSLVASTTAESADPAIARQNSAYLAVLWAKEKLGLLRAQMGAAYTNQGWAPGQERLVSRLLGQVDIELADARGFAGEDVAAQLDTLAASATGQQVTELITAALDDGALDQDPAAWFATVTEYIDGYRDVENTLAAQQVAAAADNVRSTWVSFAIRVIVLAAVVTLLILMGAMTTRSLRARVRSGVRNAEALAAGDLSARFLDDGRDELSALGRSINQALDRIEATLRDVIRHSHALGESAGDVGRTSDSLSAAASTARGDVTSAVDATNRMNEEVQALAGASEQLRASIAEIASNCTQAASVADTAVTLAGSTRTTMTRLGTASSEIGDVIGLISGIAEQTNLLALNATIESARAGEAGKGFAVVASEVKDLAQETSRATGDITTRISDIQSQATEAVEAIDRISEVIGRINEIQTSIAGAAEEQAAVTQEVSSSVHRSARESEDLRLRIDAIAGSVSATDDGAGNAQRASTSLTRLGGDLRSSLAAFRIKD
ncbi:methyl-accepting chemotaxis protein [Mangrovihabitans endophyticus]|uniref:Methyl-accepting chemotaxis sensory transducer n=1 Tax=Mangrovihabitans endophyticus TaxID=1751298 RepID=A0A8J3C7J2_9ACTN|nr:methyl-accepting chemotaxis protein [Mangrovihabitans endophyticus]GGL16709.1 methyl-accepting chemotaxis sensory transducer [Mangrovihabitans endophyticus]